MWRKVAVMGVRSHVLIGLSYAVVYQLDNGIKATATDEEFIFILSGIMENGIFPIWICLFRMRVWAL